MRASAGSISWPARQAPAPIFFTTARSRFPVPHAGSKIAPSMTGGIIEAMIAASSSEVTGAGRGSASRRTGRAGPRIPPRLPARPPAPRATSRRRTWPGCRPSANGCPPGMRVLGYVGGDGIWATARQDLRPAGLPVPARSRGCRRERAELDERQERGDVGQRPRRAATPRCRREAPATAAHSGRSRPACRWRTAMPRPPRGRTSGWPAYRPLVRGSPRAGAASSTPLPARLRPCGRPGRPTLPLPCPRYPPSCSVHPVTGGPS